MQIVKIWREAESLNGTLDVLFDVGGRIGDCARSPNAIKAAFGCNYKITRSIMVFGRRRRVTY